MNYANTHKTDVNYRNTMVSDAAHPLKGFLMDKGERTSLRLMCELERRTKLIGRAMQALSDEHARIANEFGCDYLRLYCLRQDRYCTGVGRGNNRLDPRIVDFGLKDSLALVWLANPVLCRRSGNKLKSSRRLSPFSPDQKDFEVVSQILREDAPDYYLTIAAVETIRISLNSSFKALRNLTVDAMKVNYEAGLKEMPEFSSATMKASEKLFQVLDPTGETAMTMRGLFSC